MRYDALAVAALMGLALVYIHRRSRRSIRTARAAMFDACLPLLDAYRVTQDGLGFPVLEGRYRGHDVQIQPVVDHVAVRKLPSLWLLVTVRGPVRYEGTLDFLVRPLNVEFFSPSATLEKRLPVPPGWPPHSWLRTDDPERMPPVEVVAPHIGFFEDPKAKELLVTPQGVRLVYQGKEGQRAHYAVLRQVEFGDIAVPPELARELLDRALALYRDVEREGRT